MVEGKGGIKSVGRAALQLALALSDEEEKSLKEQYTQDGFLCAVTKTKGDVEAISQSIKNSAIDLAVKEGLIKNVEHEIHAVLHAALEAREGLVIKTATGAGLDLRIGVVRRENWVAVAVYGFSGLHSYAYHERAGLGVMNV